MVFFFASVLAPALYCALILSPPPLSTPSIAANKPHPRARNIRLEVVSPFAAAGEDSDSSSSVEVKDEASAAASAPKSSSGPLPLTLDNVELVLDDMRPYLMADGGNVAVVDIEGGIVKLELQGACGSCPSSTMTMKMGLERGLLEKIPEIVAVEQVQPEGPQLTQEGIEGVLDEIRPFLKMAGGSVDLIDLDATGVQPTAKLAITGSGSTINSVRVEIAQRLKRNFPTLANVDFD